SQIYSDTLSTPENQAFVKDFRERYNEFPDTYSEYGFVTSYIIENALKKTNGVSSNKEAFAQAIGETSFNAPRGPFRFDPVTHNPIQNVYVTEVTKADGRYIQKVIGTIDNVRDPGQKPT